MNEEKNSKRMFYVIMGIALTLVLGIGISFAVFTAQANRNPNLVTTGTLQIRYTEGSTITANNLKPATVEQVKDAYTHGSCVFEGDRTAGFTTEKICAYKTFTITNIGSLTAYTTVMVEDVTNTYQNLKYQLFETTPDTLSGSGLLNTSELANDIKLLPNGNKTYTLLIWLDESATIETDQNKSYTAKITASAITTTNKNLDTSGANAPVLADGMVPIAYKQCGEIDSPSYENYPGCYNEVYENINDDDIAGLQTFCVNDLEMSAEECEFFVNELITNGAIGEGEDILTLDYFISMYESSGYTMTTEKTKVLSLENYNTYVADSNNLDITYQWYDYNNKQWANAVMVSSHTRDAYMNAAEGTPVKEEDILAYYVWIPRYKYQLFNVEFAQTSEQLINIEFERGIASTGNVRCSTSEIGVETCTNKANGNWYTHPAFTFGDQQLQGLWVGKFETTYGTNTTDVYPDNTVYETPTIKPNVTALQNQQVSIQFQTAQYFGTSAYLTNRGVNEVDAHMMKNSEWGAVAYLKQSTYGLGITDIALNSNNIPLTGCGPQSAGSEDYGSICNAYHTTLGMSASTTGNITGVYDMAGGTYEYTMGVIQDNTTSGRSPMSGYSTEGNSGYIGKVYYDSNYNSGYFDSGNTLSFPAAKYYDLYANGTTQNNQTAYNRSHLGDATGETRGWYSDWAYFSYASSPWFGRGGRYNDGSSAGVFDFNVGDGIASTVDGFRVALSTTGA